MLLTKPEITADMSPDTGAMNGMLVEMALSSNSFKRVPDARAIPAETTFRASNNLSCQGREESNIILTALIIDPIMQRISLKIFLTVEKK